MLPDFIVLSSIILLPFVNMFCKDATNEALPNTEKLLCAAVVMYLFDAAKTLCFANKRGLKERDRCCNDHMILSFCMEIGCCVASMEKHQLFLDIFRGYINL